MSMVRWEPFREMISLRDAIDKLFEESFVRPATDGLLPSTIYPMDVYEDGDNLVVEMALPGIKPEDVDISVMGETLTIKGENKAGEDAKNRTYLAQERRYGSFSRTVTLPSAVDTAKAQAQYRDGVLFLTLPKSEAAKPKSIKIQAR